MSAEEYLHYFAALYKIDTHLARNRAKELLEKVGLATKSFVPISFYSRGMKQRLGLARTLINEPKILFLDEPTLSLLFSLNYRFLEEWNLSLVLTASFNFFVQPIV